MSDHVVTAKEWAEAYRVVLAAGRLVCAVEDRHKGRWWPSYAVRALRHRETGCPDYLRRGLMPGQPCDACRRAAREWFL